MSILRNSRSKSVSHKFKRTLAFNSWRRNISGKEKWLAKEPKRITFLEL